MLTLKHFVLRVIVELNLLIGVKGNFIPPDYKSDVYHTTLIHYPETEIFQNLKLDYTLYGIKNNNHQVNIQ